MEAAAKQEVDLLRTKSKCCNSCTNPLPKHLRPSYRATIYENTRMEAVVMTVFLGVLVKTTCGRFIMLPEDDPLNRWGVTGLSNDLLNTTAPDDFEKASYRKLVGLCSNSTEPVTLVCLQGR